ncbi:MAG: hypothetical protein M3R08_11955 [Bacteroidota bacterium]|nr:hypothetical protein [Bacteroidota bacterium]
MKILSTKALLLGLSLFATFLAPAQQVQIDGVRPKEFRGVNPIKGKGYYTYYVNEKLGKGMVQFALEIYDLDLNLIKKTDVEVTKFSNLVGSEFNGNDFLFLFEDIKNKSNTFVSIDASGNIIKKNTEPTKKIVTQGTTDIYAAEDGTGFYWTHAVKEKKWGYEVVKLDRDLKELWSKTVTVDKGMTTIAAAQSGPGKLILVSMELPSLMSKKMLGKIVSFNGTTGQKEYEYPLFDGKQTNLPGTFLIEPDGTVTTSGMYYDGEKMAGDNSDGIFFLKLDPSGKKVAFNSIDWDNGIQEALKATKRKFSIGSKPKVQFHNIVKEPNGNYQVISETFRKAAGAGTALAALGGADANDIPLRFTVMDFIIFNFDPQGEPLDINKIEKPYKSMSVEGAMNMNGIQLAQLMKRYKMFTYEYTTVLPSGKPAIVFTNFEDAGLGVGKPYVGVATIEIGKDSESQKIPLPKKYTSFVTGSPDNLKAGTLQGKPGKFCLFVYDKKAKAIMMSIEDITASE